MLNLAERAIYWMKWKRALPEELAFWDEWLTTKGGEWPEDYVRRFDGAGELQENLKEYLRDAPGSEVSILDVGSGPMTRLGYQWAGRRLRLTATDALANRYNALFTKHGAEPPMRSIECSAERLTRRFPADGFDLAYCRNALDHAHDPLRAVREMIAVTKPGGLVVLEHYENEAEQSRYAGLHQWNFSLDGGHLTVANHRRRIDIVDAVADVAIARCHRTRVGRDWVIAVFTKKFPTAH